jgi:hypothetical protein
MDKNRFDGLTRQLAQRENRRQALKTLLAGGVGAAAVVLGGTGADAKGKPDKPDKPGKPECCPTSAPRLCGLTCTDTSSDASNCGACGTTCQSYQTCTDGVCTGAAPECTNAQECPASSNECKEAACAAGVCEFTNRPAGTPITPQTPGDCHVEVCDGNGGTTPQIDNTDTPASGPCTTGTCTAGSPSQPPKAAGTSCPGGICDGSGNCVDCLTPSNCPGADDECGVRTCVDGNCGMSFQPANTPTSNQTTGDCKKNVCDGAGNIISVNDDTDVINTHYSDECVETVCSGGSSITQNKAYGSSCGSGFCDGAGTCLGCLVDGNCPDSGVPNTVTICDSGHCSYQCIDGYTECIPNGGGCVDTSIDLDHCGACNHPCQFANATAVCDNGTCGIEACDFGYGDCDGNAANGCETFLIGGDADNCGACGNSCDLPHTQLTLCSGGACQILTCETGWGNCDSSTANGCETDLSGDPNNCGTCGRRCSGDERCRNGVCAL